MEIKYDLHIHTGLSPCAMLEMTPNNIVNMAKLYKLDVIGITDHNSCEQVEVVMKVASQRDLLILPGMEIETAEEVHILCFFSSLEAMNRVQKRVYEGLPSRKNRVDIFGEQVLYSKQDDQIGFSDRLLSFGTDISLTQLVQLCDENRGLCIPAHIDRPSYSIISNLGMLPDKLIFPTLEISKYAEMCKYRAKYPKHRIIQSSDAHELEHIGTCHQTLDVPARTIESILATLKQQIG